MKKIIFAATIAGAVLMANFANAQQEAKAAAPKQNKEGAKTEKTATTKTKGVRTHTGKVKANSVQVEKTANATPTETKVKHAKPTKETKALKGDEKTAMPSGKPQPKKQIAANNATAKPGMAKKDDSKAQPAPVKK